MPDNQEPFTLTGADAIEAWADERYKRDVYLTEIDEEIRRKESEYQSQLNELNGRASDTRCLIRTLTKQYEESMECLMDEFKHREQRILDSISEPESGWLDTKGAAEYLSMGITTFKQKVMPHLPYSTLTGKPRFHKDDLDNAMRSIRD